MHLTVHHRHWVSNRNLDLDLYTRAHATCMSVQLTISTADIEVSHKTLTFSHASIETPLHLPLMSMVACVCARTCEGLCIGMIGCLAQCEHICSSDLEAAVDIYRVLGVVTLNSYHSVVCSLYSWVWVWVHVRVGVLVSQCMRGSILYLCLDAPPHPCPLKLAHLSAFGLDDLWPGSNLRRGGENKLRAHAHVRAYRDRRLKFRCREGGKSLISRAKHAGDQITDTIPWV